MPKKKSVKHIADEFLRAATDIEVYLRDCGATAGFRYMEYAYDYAALWLYMEFEYMMLQALVGAVNNNTAATIGARTGIAFPRHLSDEACEYLVTGDGYFDFKGRDGLIKCLKQFLLDTHYVVTTVADPKYKASIERLVALRNFAAHGSSYAKKKALATLGVRRLRSAGAWLSKLGRFDAILAQLRGMATDLKARAPY